jgi:glycosyltransferase involved in cell wall biosynthesis
VRIAIDARELQGQPTGVGRYLAEILAAWGILPAATSHEFILCAPGPFDAPATGRLNLSTIVSGGGGTRWEQLTLPRLVRHTNADVLLAPGYTGPLMCPVPMVVAIHDVSFAAHPEWFGWREGLRRRTLTRLSARRAARVLTISEFSRQEIASRLGVTASKIDVIYPGAAINKNRQTSPQRTEENLILYAGSLFNRRHIPELIEGFAGLARRRSDVRLEIVGANRTIPAIDVDRLAATANTGNRIAVRSYVPDDQLAALFCRARAFVFLSDYEGFGLTPLEALAAGAPIVVLDTPVAREIYRDAALYVARPDPPLVQDALERILFDEAERSRILDAAPAVLRRYSWTTCAEQVLRVLLAISRSPFS